MVTGSWFSGDVTWEPRKHLIGAEEALKEFKKLENSAQEITNSDVRMNYFKCLKRCKKNGCANIGFSTYGGLKQHENKVHGKSIGAKGERNEKKAKCEICGQGFKSEDHKKVHKDRIHNGLVYVCKLRSCGFISLNRPDAYAHCKDSVHSFEMIKDPLFNK